MIVWCGKCEENLVEIQAAEVETLDFTRYRPMCIPCLAGDGLETLATVSGHTWRDSLLQSFMKWQPN